MTQYELIADLKVQLRNLQSAAKEYQRMDLGVLNRGPTEGKWSILECFEHMNMYGEIYLNLIGKALAKAKSVSGDKEFKPGLLGSYSANSMLPKQGVIKNRMKTFQKMNPIGSELDKKVFKQFEEHQNSFGELLDQCKDVDMNKVKVKLTIPVFRFRLGDTFRFVINHNVRHLVQARNILNDQGE